MRLNNPNQKYDSVRNFCVVLTLLSTSLLLNAQTLDSESDTNRHMTVPPRPVVEEIFKVRKYPQANVSLSDFAELMIELDSTRATRLLSLDEFLAMSADESTVVLDARSRDMYAGRHLDVAVNLPYTEFTEEALKQIIPSHTSRVLIYCNNNFGNDDEFFQSKRMSGFQRKDGIEAPERLLALNIPTHITLLGYGYTEVYELGDFVPVSAPELRDRWQGTSIEH